MVICPKVSITKPNQRVLLLPARNTPILQNINLSLLNSDIAHKARGRGAVCDRVPTLPGLAQQAMNSGRQEANFLIYFFRS